MANDTDKLRTLDLFSGIGGISLALQPWCETVCYCEIDPYAQKVLAKNIKNENLDNAPILHDIKQIHTKLYLDSIVKTWYIPKNGIKYTNKERIMAGKLKKLTVEQAAECVVLYEKGMSCGQVAGYFNVSRQAMWDLLKRRTTLRPQKKVGAENHFYRGGAKADDHAQNMVEYAVKSGVLVPSRSCEKCGNTGIFKDGRSKIQAHHADYNKPLDVEWLCQKCHHDWHRENTAIRKGVMQELPGNIDMITGGFP